MIVETPLCQCSWNADAMVYKLQYYPNDDDVIYLFEFIGNCTFVEFIFIRLRAIFSGISLHGAAIRSGE